MSKRVKIISTSIIFIIVLILFLLFPMKEYKVKNSKEKKLDNIGIITKEDKIVQEFTPDRDYDNFGLCYANYGAFITEGDLVITIKDNKTNKSTTIEKKLIGLIDSKYVYFDYELKKNHGYIITIENKSDNNITFYIAKDNNEKTKLYLNDVFKEEDLILSFRYLVKINNMLWYYFMILFMFLGYIVLTKGGKK